MVFAQASPCAKVFAPSSISSFENAKLPIFIHITTTKTRIKPGRLAGGVGKMCVSV
jgi:hypothetical protein